MDILSLDRYLAGINFISLLAYLFVVVYLIYSFILVYHFIRFGIGTKPKMAALIYFSGSILLLLILAISYMQVDFSSFRGEFLPQGGLITPYHR